MPKPPGLPSAVPVFGHLLEFRKGAMKFMIRSHEALGDIAWLQSPFRDVALVYKPEYIRYMLQENAKRFQKSFGYDELQVLLGNGLLTSEGDFWRQQRRLAQPAFHKERLAYLVDIMGDCVLDIVYQWKKNYAPGSVVNISLEMNKLALEIVSRTLFQSDISPGEVEILNQSLGIVIETGAKRIRDPFQPPRWVPTPTNISSKKAVKNIKHIVGNIIHKRMAEKKRHDDLLDMLVHAVDEETGKGMNEAQLLDEVMTIFIAGHETTANSLAFCWYLLASNPAEKEKLLTEIRQFDIKKPAIQHLRELKYHRMVIDEALRLYPPAWIMGRQALHPEKFGEYDIPALCTMGIPVYVVHRSEKYWERPDDFIPERFSEENAGKIEKFSYLPFGGGPRLCIGQMFAIYEMQIAMYILWKEFDFKLAAGFKLELEPLITLRTKHPVMMELHY